MQLSSPRLSLSPFQNTDVQLFHEINTTPFVRKYLWDDEVISLDTAKEILAVNAQHFNQDQYGLWKIERKVSAKTVIGYAGLWYFFDEPQPQLLYALLEPYKGKGYASEAAQLIIDYAFNQLSFNYLIAATDEPHRASQKVALSLGMELSEKRKAEGKLTHFYRLEKTLK